MATPMVEVAMDIFRAWQHTSTQTLTLPISKGGACPIIDAQIHSGRWKEEICCSSFLEPSYMNFNCYLKTCTYTYFFPQDFFFQVNLSRSSALQRILSEFQELLVCQIDSSVAGEMLQRSVTSLDSKGPEC